MAGRNCAPLMLCALLVPVSFVLYSQRQCTELMSPLRSGQMAAAANGAHHPSTSLAYEQSFGFFDDITDEEWKVRQRRARTHRHYRSAEHHKPDPKKPNKWYMLNYHPLFTCPNQERVGGAGDGPKWVCDPLRLKKKASRRGSGGSAGQGRQHESSKAAAEAKKGVGPARAADSDKCLVYSVGCSGNYLFEDGLVETLGAGTCEIHVFDLRENFTRPGDAETKDIHFHYWGLKSSYDKSGLLPKYNYMTLQETMAKLGHTHRTIDLFKIDCEGCEWKTYKDWTSDEVDIRQLMIETHGVRTANPSAFFDGIQEAGFALFSKEANILVMGKAIEWSFVRLHRDFFRESEKSGET